jgi:glutamate carboxypeptidase
VITGPSMQARAAALQDAMTERLAALVMCESPTESLPALHACADLLEPWGDEATGRRAERVIAEGMPHLLWRAPAPRVLVLGHFDTVWPVGTTDGWPFAVTGNSATGPGVFDMKAGIVQMLAALRLCAGRDHVSLLLTSDEETGSMTSRSLIEAEARTVAAVLVGEPSADGALKIARKGVARYEILVRGRAAHAGVEPERGVNAAVEMAAVIGVVAALGDRRAGTSVTPTRATAGTTINTVPETARISVDARAWTAAELQRVHAAVQGLEPGLAEANLSVTGGITRPPMEAAMAETLAATAQQAAEAAGVSLPPAVRSGGASDGNLTSALGIPTLDGLGAVGAHPHARGEHVLIDTMAGRAGLLAELIDRL